MLRFRLMWAREMVCFCTLSGLLPVDNERISRLYC